MEPEELIEELEDDVEGLERGMDRVESSGSPDSLWQKQERAEELLEEIHGQLEFLRKQVKRGKELNFYRRKQNVVDRDEKNEARQF